MRGKEWRKAFHFIKGWVTKTAIRDGSGSFTYEYVSLCCLVALPPPDGKRNLWRLKKKVVLIICMCPHTHVEAHSLFVVAPFPLSFSPSAFRLYGKTCCLKECLEVLVISQTLDLIITIHEWSMLFFRSGYCLFAVDNLWNMALRELSFGT